MKETSDNGVYFIAQEQVMTDIKVTLIRPGSYIRKCPKQFQTSIEIAAAKRKYIFSV